MKKIKISLAFVLVAISFNAFSQIKVLSNGNLNLLNTTSSYGYFTIDRTANMGYACLYPSNSSCNLGKPGNGFNIVYTYYTLNASDARLKENIKDVTGALDIVKKLHGVQFDYKKNTIHGQLSDKYRKNCLGFLAQDVQKILPQVVLYDDSTDIYSIDYTKVIPVLVEAIKEQQTMIDQLTTMNNNGNNQIKKAAANSTDFTETDALTYPVLDQNVPNPFNTATTIGFYLPNSIAAASIYVYDMNGGQLKSISIPERGKGTVTIQGSELIAGMYLYALIADKKVIDTKRMILTK